MIKERNKAVPAVYLILRKEDKVLLMRRQNTGYYDGWYSVPAGHVETGELPIQALAREAAEEIGVTIDKSDLRPVHTMYRTKHDETGDRLDLFFHCDKWSGEIINNEPHKCDDVQWFPVSALPEKIVHHVKDAIKSFEDGIYYSELDLEHITLNPSK